MGLNTISVLILTLSLNLINGLPFANPPASPKFEPAKFMESLGKTLKDTSDLTGQLSNVAKTAAAALTLLEPIGEVGKVIQDTGENLVKARLSGKPNNGSNVDAKDIVKRINQLKNSIRELLNIVTDISGLLTNPNDVFNRAYGIVSRQSVEVSSIFAVIQKSIGQILNITKSTQIKTTLKNINDLLSRTIAGLSSTIGKVLGMVTNKNTTSDIINVIVGDLGSIVKNVTNDVNQIIGSISGIGGNVVNATIGGILNNTNGIVNNTIGSIGNLTNTLNNVTTNLGNAVGSVTGSVGNLTSSVGTILNNTIGNLGNATGSITGSTGNLTSAITGTLNNVTGSLGNTLGSITGSTRNLTSVTGKTLNNTTAGLSNVPKNIGVSAISNIVKNVIPAPTADKGLLGLF